MIRKRLTGGNMQIKIDATGKTFDQTSVKVHGVTQKETKTGKKTTKSADLAKLKDAHVRESLKEIKSFSSFKANSGETFQFTCSHGDVHIILGLGNAKNVNKELLRKNIAKVHKSLRSKFDSYAIDTDSVKTKKAMDTYLALFESLFMAEYTFNKYKSNPKNAALETVIVKVPKKDQRSASQVLKNAKASGESINFARDLVNEVPNYLHSEKYAQVISKDVRENLKGVKVKVLNKEQIKKEKMNLLLSVNAGSGYQPRLVHLTYTPKKVTKKTKHIALVGKGITFDTGGYSLKPSASIMGMKFDMGGSATVYGAFRSAVLQGSPHKLTCVLAMTDNAVNEYATMPDSVIKGRSGKTVEILNTDAEGRLILADALDYTCDLKPDVVMNAATLTGACLVALGDEVCGLMSNNDSLVKSLYKAAKNVDEYIWQLPIVPEFRDAIKSQVADIKNIGKPMRAGTAIAGAFLEEFIKNDVQWAHFDIAGVASDQAHLPYCPSKGASGIMIRTMVEYILNEA
jgi:leucyl aminopeptidase